jgi:hypothetical protein
MPTIYRSGDPGAPPMDGTPGAMVNVLDGCLVHGYGALATGVLTSDNNNVVAGDTVTIGSITYTFRASVTVLNDVQIGANADASLLNLINTINLTGSAGTTYMLAQSGHPEVYSVISVTAHAFMITAKRPGTLGNAVGTTETAASLSWGGTTLTGGSVSKASLGWTKDYSALARGIYRAPVASGGSRTYLEVIDNSPDVSNGSFNARVQGLETVSALGGGVLLSSGSGPFGHLVNASWAKSAALSWVQRPWMFIGDDRTFYLFVQAGQAANAYYCFAFGDHRSLVAGDTAKGFLLAHGAFATASSYSTSELTGVGGIAIQQGHYLQRNWSGVISNISWGKQGDGGWRGNPLCDIWGHDHTSCS